MGKIVIIGAITRDILIYLDDEKENCHVIKSLGGILHIVKAFSVLAKYFPKLREKEILPITNVGFDVYDEIIREIQSLDGKINLEGIHKYNEKNIHSYILFASEYGTQYDENLEKPVTYEQVESYLGDIDFVIVSPMTGYDVDISIMKNLKKEKMAPVYFDYHILSLKRDKLGNRYLQKREDWFEWCTSCDYLQLNKFEAELLFDTEIDIKSNIVQEVKPILNNGVKSVAITFGEKGSVICYIDKGDYKQQIIPAKSYGKTVNTTACGDIYAAGFISFFIEYGEIIDAYRFASKVASLKTQVKDVKDLVNKEEEIRKILEQWHQRLQKT